MINNTIRIFKYTVQHIARNWWQSASVVLVMAATLLIGQLFIVTMVASNQILVFFENQPQVTVFFQDEATEDQILQIKKELEKEEAINEVAYISKEQAVEIYREQHQDDPELLEFVTPDILPASLEISATDPRRLAEVAMEFEDNQFVEEVIYQQDLVDELLNWTQAIRTAGIVLLAVQGFILIVLITLVIANNINVFSREIEIMRLVGAGSWYIRWPFILDGILFALAGASIASLSLWWLLPYIRSFIDTFIMSGAVLPADQVNLAQYWLYSLAIGSAFTSVVSFLAVWRHLRT